jgi:hypothetical protein
MKTSLEFIIDEAISYAAKAFDADQDISGADLVEWFADWRQRARAIVGSNRSPSSAAIYGQQFHSQLIDALRALQLMQDRARVESRPLNQLCHRGRNRPATHAQSQELIQALDNGGIQITAGQFKAVVFKHSAKGPS